MVKKKNALEKARSALKKAEGANTVRSIKNKLKRPMQEKADGKAKTRRSERA